MADVNNSLSGKVLSFKISTNTTTPSYKNVVCSQGDIGVNGTITGGTEVSSRCGVLKAAGIAGWEIAGTAIGNKTLTNTEMSINEMAALFQSQASFFVQVQDETTPANYYRQGQGILSAYKETGQEQGVITFDFTVAISGPLDLTA